MKFKLLIAGFYCFAFLAAPPPVSAEQRQRSIEQTYNSQNPSSSANHEMIIDVPEIDVVNVKVAKDKYTDPNFENLSKLMWALSVHQLSDNNAIDNYLRINECELYKRFYNNDLEWEKIRNATRSYINKNIAEFPTHFEIIIPIYLGRYNAEEQYFLLSDASKLNGTRRLFIRTNKREKICEIFYDIKGYPLHLILNFMRPITLSNVPVDRQLAELYMEESRVAFEKLPPRAQLKAYERIAYMRAKVKITGFKEFENENGGRAGVRASVLAQLEGIEIYADKAMQKPIFKKDIKRKSMRQQRIEARNRGTEDAEALEIGHDKDAEESEESEENDTAPPEGGHDEQ